MWTFCVRAAGLSVLDALVVLLGDSNVKFFGNVPLMIRDIYRHIGSFLFVVEYALFVYTGLYSIFQRYVYRVVWYLYILFLANQ